MYSKRTFVDAVLRDVDVYSSLDGSTLDVLQLLHRFFSHVLQLANMVIHIGNLHLACGPCAPGGYLPRRNSTTWYRGLCCQRDDTKVPL